MSMAKTLAAWHVMVKTRDVSVLCDFTIDEPVFRSPMAHTPYHGKAALIFALSNVIEVFEDFTYQREFINEEMNAAVLEFSASVDGKALKGIDLITFNKDGLITEFEVMIRPMSGLQALAQGMAPRMAKLGLK